MDAPRSAPPSPIRGDDAKGIGTEPSGRSAVPRPGLTRERADKAARAASVYIAGGLTPENAAEAAARVRPAGVDVNSGVEDAKGRKDTAKMHAFVARARAGLLGRRAAT